MPFLLPLLLASAAPAGATAAQPAKPAVAQPQSDPFRAEDAGPVIVKLATALEQNFVFPSVAKAYATMLRSKSAAGAYASFPSAQAFADQVSKDLQAVHADAHLRLHVIPPEDRGASADERPISLPATSAVTKSGWIAPGVAYISFSMFPGNEATIKQLRAFLDAHKDAKSLIIDARGHRGGGLEEMDMILGEVFSKPTALLMLDTRTAAEERGNDPASLTIVPTTEDVVRRLHTALPDSTPTALRTADIYYLTSKKTASAGEHFALSLKRTHRATVIGETTRGAGHYGDMVAVGSIYAAFIPVGRTFNPDTSEGWETVGVKPDVVTTADAALDEALRRAGVRISGEAALAALR